MEVQVQHGRSASEAFREALRRRVGDARYATWFEGSSGGDGAVAIQVADDQPEVCLLTSTPFEQTLVRKQMLSDLQAAAVEAIGAQGQVTFAVQTRVPRSGQRVDSPSPNVAPSEPRRTTRRRLERAAAAGLAIEPARRIPRVEPPQTAAPAPAPSPSKPAKPDGWISGAPNAAATRLGTRIASGQPGPTPALLWGPSGVGKSHLLRKVAEGLRGRRRRVLLITADEFLRGFVNAARGGSFPAFRQKFEGLDALLLDDVQQLLGKKKTLEELRQTVDDLVARGVPVVMTADRGPGSLRDLGPEMTSRLAGGLSVEIEAPDVAMRQKLAAAAAERLGYTLPAATAHALACRLIGGGREVRGAVNRLILMHETFDKPLDERLAEQVAEDANRLSTPPVRLPDIERAVCEVFDVDGRALRSDKRTKAVTEPRMLAMFLARRMTGSAWSEIGDYFHRKSHSTVIAAHKRVEKLLASDGPVQLKTGELGETIRRVEAALRSA